ncbi:MAG TPA: formyltransferase family protein [Candidatus Limnocylindrales bacterium]|nr:formyltransferase family protein [Candidatus Limnocylindrales bacterium]
MPARPGRAFDDAWLEGLWDDIWAKREFSMIPLDYQEVPSLPYQGQRAAGDRLRVVFCGIPSDYGTSFLLHLIGKRVNLAAVVCSTRWQRTHPTTDLLARIAGHIGTPVEIAASVNTPAFRNCLKAYAPDVVVMASFDQIIDAQTLAVPRRGWINVHPSLLPRHRGPEPIYWAIRNGDATAGITLHWTVPRIDAGPILAQEAVPMRKAETAGTLARRLVEAGLPALDRTLDRLERGDLPGRQPALEDGSYEPPVRETELDWDASFEEIDRLVRAGSPDQPPRLAVDGERRYVLAVRRLRARRGERPGLLGDRDGRVLAATSDAVVEVLWRGFGHTHAVRPLRHQQFP